MWVAPISLAFSSLNGTGSTATIWRAPASRAPWMAPEPTPPHPTTTTVSPGTTLARSTEEPKPVDSPQLMRAAAFIDTWEGILTSEASLAVTRSENVPSWVIRLSGWPSRWWRHTPSMLGPARPEIPRSHRCWRPDAHQKQRPHDGMNDMATWSPTATDSTSAPSDSTTPAPS